MRFLTLSSIEALANESGSSENCERKATKCTTIPGDNDGTCRENVVPSKGWNCVDGSPKDCDGEVEID